MELCHREGRAPAAGRGRCRPVAPYPRTWRRAHAYGVGAEQSPASAESARACRPMFAVMDASLGSRWCAALAWFVRRCATTP